MAPIAMDSVMSWVSSPEVAVIASVAFLVLSITLLALCTNCNRRGDSGYDVNGTMRNGRTNGSTKSEGGQDFDVTEWRPHILPPNTLESFQSPANQPATVSTGQ